MLKTSRRIFLFHTNLSRTEFVKKICAQFRQNKQIRIYRVCVEKDVIIRFLISSDLFTVKIQKACKDGTVIHYKKNES